MKIRFRAGAALILGICIILSIYIIRANRPSGPERAAGRALPLKNPAGSGWSRWRGPSLNGISEESDWDTGFAAKPLKIKWKINIGAGFSNLSISGDLIYTMGFDKETSKNTVYCLKSATGEEKWKYSYLTSPLIDPFQGPRSTPVLDEGRLYTFGQNGECLCNDAATGKFIWNRYLTFAAVNPPRALAASPYIQGDLLLINAYKSGLALNKRTGNIIWKSEGTTGNNSTPVPYSHKGNDCIALFGQWFLYGIEPESGKTFWTYPWKTQFGVNAADPAVYGSRLFISSGYTDGCALVDLSGERPVTLWKNRNLNAHIASPVICGDYVYGIDGDAGRDAKLVCLDLRNGQVRWKSDRTGCGNFIIAAGCIIMVSETGDLLVAEATPEKFKPLGKQKKALPPICLTSPVLYRSCLYLRNSKGDILSIDVAGKADSSGS